MSRPLLAVVAGVGPGAGAAIARKFASQYPVVCLARKPESFNDVVAEINSSGGKALGIATDLSSSTSLQAAMATIGAEFGEGYGLSAAIFNAGGKFVRKPFLELTQGEFASSCEVPGNGAFLFAQATIPLLLASVANSQHPPSLIFTGATAALKSSSQMAAFAAGKWIQRSLAQSLAKEFGPQGVHVSHAIVDGFVDTPQVRELVKETNPDAMISPAAIADAYWYLHMQPRNCFTWEMDIRPYVEKW
ncbi:Short-chain dehydrogenase/reductase SDR [Lasiodiplodia theobromae]|uniref:Putative oxidoreductase YciK n=1 Tax=Lasiodiplodia theobromae TaxID=45133 RepID=A0A5N5DF89_9PEZI|nr:Short-chain dehydrogenase/reductase SDR [Lasiodiplodia theobromae]KAB2576405.1 putative oxidoreductase YciK [Lasiodiplodia theobromae]KAF4544046.1 Short-chain dehydrogenase/reductase SDR [Lasiodiplodia theobromae]